MAQGIRILTGCRISGRGLAPGTYSVPGDISAEEAALLVRIGRAEDAYIEDQEPLKKRGRPRKVADDGRRD